MINLIIKLTLTAFYPKYLQYFFNCFKFFSKNIYIIGPIFSPVQIKRFCILRAPTRYTDARDQLEIRFYKMKIFIKIKNKKNFINFFNILFNQINTLTYSNIKFKIDLL